MTKIKKISKNNIVTFPSKLKEGEREVEALVFAAAEPLDIDTIESKISKKINVLKTLEKLKKEYSLRDIVMLIGYGFIIDAEREFLKIKKRFEPEKVKVIETLIKLLK